MHLGAVSASCAVIGCCWPTWHTSTWPARSRRTTSTGSPGALWRPRRWWRSPGGTALSWWQHVSHMSMRASCSRPLEEQKSPVTAAPCRLAWWSWLPEWWWQPWLTRSTRTAQSSRFWAWFCFVLDYFCWVPVPSAGDSNAGRRRQISGGRARRPLWSARNIAWPDVLEG